MSEITWAELAEGTKLRRKDNGEVWEYVGWEPFYGPHVIKRDAAGNVVDEKLTGHEVWELSKYHAVSPVPRAWESAMTDDLESIVREIEQQTVGTEHTGLPCEQSGYEHMCEVYVAARMIAEARRQAEVERQKRIGLEVMHRNAPVLAGMSRVQPTEAEKWMAEATEQLKRLAAERDAAQEELNEERRNHDVTGYHLSEAEKERDAALARVREGQKREDEYREMLDEAHGDINDLMESERKRQEVIDHLRAQLAEAQKAGARLARAIKYFQEVGDDYTQSLLRAALATDSSEGEGK